MNRDRLDALDLTPKDAEGARQLHREACALHEHAFRIASAERKKAKKAGKSYSNAQARAEDSLVAAADAVRRLGELIDAAGEDGELDPKELHAIACQAGNVFETLNHMTGWAAERERAPSLLHGSCLAEQERVRVAMQAETDRLRAELGEAQSQLAGVPPAPASASVWQLDLAVTEAQENTRQWIAYHEAQAADLRAQLARKDGEIADLAEALAQARARVRKKPVRRT